MAARKKQPFIAMNTRFFSVKHAAEALRPAMGPNESISVYKEVRGKPKLVCFVKTNEHGYAYIDYI